MFKEFSKTFKIALPLIISNVSQVGLGLIDSAMIGAVDYHQLAASSLVLNVIAIPQILGMGMAIAVSPMTAIANGQKDIFKASVVLYNGFVLTTLVAIMISATLVLCNPLLFHLGQDEKVATYAVPFFKLIAWSLIPMLMFASVKQFCDGLEYTKTAMTLSLISLPLNAFLNWILIYGRFGFPRLELAGAGLGTLITRTIIAITLIVIVFRHKLFYKYISIRTRAWKINGKTCKELLHIGVPTSVQYGLEVAAFSVSGVMIGWLGAASQAAHQIALNLATATFMAASGLALAGSIRVSNAFGRGEKNLMRHIGLSTIAGGLIYGLLCGILFVTFRNTLPVLFTNNAEVAAVSSSLLIFAALFQISDATQSIGVGLLRGIRDVKLPTAFVAIAYWLIGIPIGYFLSFKLKMGASGIWLGFVTGLTASSILLNTRFLKKSKIVI
ncbi:MATE family efflux transporter [Segetibacter koreensis]|uniref:MATE family efflux transporter n=1 Tax=Segetibacter koreensis TaxID=398037 RepID=UPI00039C0D46|nr:MATE family efflux transporter [Segetibacter koreensis]